jgi:citrate lyase beta subunit
MHSRRALLYMPGDDRHKIEKALTLQVDSICMDLEDGVAPNRKILARRVIASALQELDFSTSERLVRINAIGSGLEQQDIEQILTFRPDGIVVPKVESLEQLQWVSGKIENAELTSGWPVNSIRLIADVETAKGMLTLKEIASHPRLDALIFGAEDYAVSIGAVRTRQGWEVFTARSMVVMQAKSLGLQAIDMVTVDFHDLERMRSEAIFQQARHLVEAFESHQKDGRGAFALEGKMIDLPLAKVAQGVLERARAAGKL